MEQDASWPPRPDFEPLSYSDRESIFGHIESVPAPVPGDPDAIRITNDFTKHLVSACIPQMELIPGFSYMGHTVGHGPKGGMVLMHELVVQPMVDLWQAWEDANLLDRIITDGGMFCARYVRGSRGVLSNHSYGTAFDLNAPWNPLKKVPALVGQKGCVRELVEIANGLGWWWGGHAWPPSYDRFDGMHFERART